MDLVWRKQLFSGRGTEPSPPSSSGPQAGCSRCSSCPLSIPFGPTSCSQSPVCHPGGCPPTPHACFCQEEAQEQKELAKAEIQKILKEKDQLTADLSSMEKSFSDLFKRFEKQKDVIEGYRTVGGARACPPARPHRALLGAVGDQAGLPCPHLVAGSPSLFGLEAALPTVPSSWPWHMSRGTRGHSLEAGPHWAKGMPRASSCLLDGGLGCSDLSGPPGWGCGGVGATHRAAR